MEKVTTKEVLKIIGVGGLVLSSFVFPNLPLALTKTYKVWKNINKHDLGRIIKRLEGQNMISIAEKNGQISIKITEKGESRLLEYDFENIGLEHKNRDGKWRAVLFDIPEEKRNARDVFRRKLLKLGLIKFQESVFISAFPCKDEIDFLCHYLDISDYVTVAVLTKIERGEQLSFKRFRYYDE